LRAPLFQIDAFTTRRFAGNPAAVIVLQSFPEDALLQAIAAENNLAEALGVAPIEVFANAFNYMVLLESAHVVRGLAPDLAAISRMDRSGVIVTAPGDDIYDFVSRYFAPAKGIPEDPVTGGAHCMLTPYWAKRLHKTEFRAFQASPRGGEMICRLVADRVEMEGACVFYLEGEVEF
jgi:predicted PhzF superfamily epimerase YddE/YHI9